MTSVSQLASSNANLIAAYGVPTVVEPTGSWNLFLQTLLGSEGCPASADITQALESPSLANPTATREASAGQLVEILSKVPRGPQKASLVRVIADWWIKTFGEVTSPEWSGSLEDYRMSLRQIRGLGPATVDQLLLLVADLPVFPLDRGALRVAIRHGWLDIPVEDEESQDVFVRGLREAKVDRRSFSRLLSRVSEDYCGREPKCDACPLQSLLPANGPLNPDVC